ncbi:hypothetical protein NW762_013935 [Fusarium torreyae]|uniref:Flavin-nucleotide-binding protein n=1 Tax=Fusarium torreyae TaxID=1237075 RepID=A0A9W8VA12_9HYPO|nr:hypothetical protein NW762_013935 [Fusarium torreyae]
MEPATLRRRKDQAAYDVDSLLAVFHSKFISNVAYVDQGLPHCLPMTALVEKQDNFLCITLHGHPSSRLIELVRKADQEARDGNVPIGTDNRIRVCITATHVDGLSLSSAPNGHEFNYRSAVVHGACSLVKDRDQKFQAMHLLTNHIVPHRWEEVNPVSSFQVSLVQVIKVEVLSGSVKSRTGIPQIQPRNTGKDGPDLPYPVWTGIIPLYEVLGVPVDSGLTDDAAVPPSVLAYIQKRNKQHKEYAELVSKKKL